MKKVILITGASSGFGRVIAEKLSKEGNIVYGTSRNPENYPKPKKYKLLKFDITSFVESENIVKKIGRLKNVSDSKNNS